VTTCTRNPLGQALTATAPEVTYPYTYDAAHRVASVRDGPGHQDAGRHVQRRGLLNSLSDSDGNVTDYVYDVVGVGWLAET
jgi:YD repeat-containing protein